MKTKYISAALLLGFLCVSGSASATPPSGIHTKYYPERGELEVIVQHPVTKRNQHYINEIVLTKNGTVIEKRTFDFQTSHRNQTTPPFKIQAVPGDDVQVLATCNISGSGEAKVKINPPEAE